MGRAPLWVACVSVCVAGCGRIGYDLLASPGGGTDAAVDSPDVVPLPDGFVPGDNLEGAVAQGSTLVIRSVAGEDFGSQAGQRMVFDDFSALAIGETPDGRAPLMAHGVSGFLWNNDAFPSVDFPFDVQNSGFFPNSTRQIRSGYSNTSQWGNSLNMDLTAWPIDLGGFVYASLSHRMERDDPGGGYAREMVLMAFAPGSAILGGGSGCNSGPHDDQWGLDAYSQPFGLAGTESTEKVVRAEFEVSFNSAIGISDGSQTGRLQLADPLARELSAIASGIEIMTSPSITEASLFSAYYSAELCSPPYPRVSWYATNIYLADTLQRVEIGNAATYADATVREPQPFTAWSTDEITVRLNLGRLPSGTAWIHVLDATSAPVNSGYPITIP